MASIQNKKNELRNWAKIKRIEFDGKEYELRKYH